MRKISLLLLFFAFSLSLSAQLIFQLEEFTPVVDDEWILAQYPNGSTVANTFFAGASGNGVEWDFSGLPPAVEEELPIDCDEHKTIWVDHTAVGEPYTGLLATYTATAHVTHASQIWIAGSQVAGYEFHGFEGTTNKKVALIESASNFAVWYGASPQITFTTPLVFGGSGNTNYTMAIPDMMEYPSRIEGIYTWQVDGEGIIKLPQGDFEAIRVHSTLSGSAYSYVLGTWILVGENIINEDEYFWYVKGHKNPIAYFLDDHAANSGAGSKTVRYDPLFDAPVLPDLEVSFEASITTPDTDEPVDFITTVNDDDGTTYLWAVSPGSQGNHWDYTNFTSGTDKDPEITFYTEGCYSIQLIATNSNYGNSPVTITVPDYINVAGGCGDAYEVTFTVTDGAKGAIEGAVITVDGYPSLDPTNSSGEATIDLYDGDYDFSVTADGFIDYTDGSFTVNGEPLSVPDVVMTAALAYTVSFTVTDGAKGAIEGAIITVDGYPSLDPTNSSGVATIDLYDGDYDFSVTADGFIDTDGTFTVNGEPLSVPNVNMSPSTIETVNTNNINIFPNPTSGFVNINSNELMQISIHDITGKIIYSQADTKSTIIDLSNQPRGMYLIKIRTQNKVSTQKIIVQ